MRGVRRGRVREVRSSLFAVILPQRVGPLHLIDGALRLGMGDVGIHMYVVASAIGTMACACGGSSQQASASGTDGSAADSDGGNPSGDAQTCPSSDCDAADSSKESGENAGCSDHEPSEGASCRTNISICSFGDSLRPDCRSLWTCSSVADGGSVWHNLRSGCSQPPDGYCPGPQPPVSTCTLASVPAGSVCQYPGNVLCRCSAQRPDYTAYNWACYGPPSTNGCADVAPNLGTPCSVQGTQCVYADPCAGGIGVYCRAGIWVNGFITCPT
jgi:hypothetical protein